MYFRHAQQIWQDYPELVPGVLQVEGITRNAKVGPRIAHYNAIAESRLAASSESEFPEIQAWRRAFSKMGLKPTQYRCASEALLRRFKKSKSLPYIHPLIDLCNAISLAFAVPVAVFDVERIADYIDVRYASGTESYLAFSNEVEAPEVGEVIFADGAGRAHARRWTNRQSAYSAVRNETRSVLIVTESMHDSAREDAQKVVTAIQDELGLVWSVAPKTAILSANEPRFEF
jgi:DNA/RNA-binding domain of Phe-tRNA-synthetase-like protein